MNGFIAWWARNSVAANLLMFACIIVGFFSFKDIDREVFPSAKFPFAGINVTWLGADPQQVEEQIILRIEEAISDINEIKSIQSTASEGRANLTIEAKPDADFESFLNELKNKVDGISTLPTDAFPPSVQQLQNNDRTHLIAIAGNIPERELNRLARKLRDEVTQIPNGSSRTILWGARNEEVAIEVSESALRRFGITFSDVAQAIRGRSINRSSGTVRTETGDVQIAARGLADSKEEFEDIIIRQAANGGTVRVKDVATVIDGFEDSNSARLLDGKEAILLNILSPTDFNVVELSKSVENWVDEKNKELNPDVKLTIMDNNADIYFANMRIVSSNAILGLFLVLIVLMLFLRAAVAFWVAIGIGVAFAGAFIFLPAVGVSLNFLSLFAFMLVTGVVVDDAIIVGESIHNQVEAGRRDLDAALIGTQLVIKPVFFAVITTMIAFAPWLFISGGTSEFTKHLSWVIILALTFSLVESFLILPAHLAHMKPQNTNGLYYRLQRGFADGILNFAHKIYAPFMKILLKARGRTVVFFIVAFTIATSLLNFGYIKTGFLPSIQAPFIDVDIDMVEGTSYTRVLQVYDRFLDAAEKTQKEFVNEKGESAVVSIFARNSDGFAGGFLKLKETAERGNIATQEIADKFREYLGEIPDAEEISVRFEFNDNAAAVSFGLESDNLESIRLALLDLQRYLTTVPGIFNIQNNLQSNTDELQIVLKPGAERFGLTLADVSAQLRQAFFGEEVQRLPRGGDDVRVIVRLPKSDRENLGTISRLFIRTPDGREIPFSAVADIEFAPSFKRIRRYDRTRSANIRAELADGYERRVVMEVFREKFLPDWQARHPDVRLVRRGEAQQQDEFNQEITSLYLIALFAIYMVLAIAFASYSQPLLIMTAIPFGFMGALFGHYLLGVELGLFSIFGIGAAAGVVINDNLVLIDYVNRLRKEGAGAYEALVRAGTGRFRPIVLTSVTTFVGLVPIMLEQSVDAQFLKPMVVAMAFGIFFASFVTLLFVPAMYLLGADFSRFMRGLWTGDKQPKVGEGASLEHGYNNENALETKKESDNIIPSPLIDPAE